MSELEKIQSYVEKTGSEERITDRYTIRLCELSALMDLAKLGANGSFHAIGWAFKYGKAKGYRAAKAEARQA